MPASLSLERDIDELFKARRKLVRRGKECRQLSALYVLRDVPDSIPNILTEGERLLVLFILPKRYVRKSHERHKLQRWFREAVRNSPITGEIESLLVQRSSQVLLGIRGESAASKVMNWQVVKTDVEIILTHLLQAIERL